MAIFRASGEIPSLVFGEKLGCEREKFTTHLAPNGHDVLYQRWPECRTEL